MAACAVTTLRRLPLLAADPGLRRQLEACFKAALATLDLRFRYTYSLVQLFLQVGVPFVVSL